jgi:hypothetical protein
VKARLVVSAVTVATSFAMVAAGVTGAAPGAPGPRAAAVADSGDVQAELVATLEDLERSLADMQLDPRLGAALEEGGGDLSESIASAIELTEQLRPIEVDALERALDANSYWQELPDAIDEVVEASSSDGGGPSGFAGAREVRSAPGRTAMALLPAVAATFTDDCASAGDPAAVATAAFALNQLQSAAYAAVIAVPSVIALFFFDIPNPAKIILAVIYGVALAAYLATSQVAAVALDCAQSAFSATQVSTLPVAGPNSTSPPPGTNVPGSSQISVDEAITAVGDIDAQMRTVDTNIDLVTSQVATLTDLVSDLNTTLSCSTGFPTRPDPPCSVPDSDVTARVTEAQADAQQLQTDVAVLRNTQHTVLDKANTELADLETFEQLQVRMEIEANLSLPGFDAVALFQLPAPWGYLDAVKVVVTETLDRYGKAGSTDLANANAAFAAGRYKDAYSLYRKAYQGATK